MRALAAVLLASVLLSSCRLGATPRTEVEIYSWWVTGPEAVGLEELRERFESAHATATVINATLDSPTEAEAREELRARLLGADPPDSFQVRLGQEWIDPWIAAGYMQPLDDVYPEYGLSDVVASDLLDLISYQGHPYAVPVDVQRANVLWYNKRVFEEHGIRPSSVSTFAGWQAAAQALNADGVIPLALGSRDAWAIAHLFEVILIGALGANGYESLWRGDSDWNSPEIAEALETLKMMLSYTNPDHPALSWHQANQFVIEGKAAMTIMGDWVSADYVAKGFTGYGWIPPPGNNGTFDALSDGFGLPKNAPHPELMQEFLGVLASKEGQETFSRLKGSLCARTDCDYTDFEPYFQSAAEDWATDEIVPSAVHGAAAPEDWTSAFIEIIRSFASTGHVASTQAALARACVKAAVCQ
jgi:glucose/mannose transport system substrate-binding protein